MTSTTADARDAVTELQCVGCVAGPSAWTCPEFRQETSDACDSHVAGTSQSGVGRLALGMPKGFDRVGALPDDMHSNIRMWLTREPTWNWNELNVPAWYRFDGQWTYVRTFLPRLGFHYVDVLPGDRTQDVLAANPHAYNVADFESEID